MILAEESSFIRGGAVHFIRVWKCCDNKTWSVTFRYDDLEAASYTPFCKRCLSGSLFFS